MAVPATKDPTGPVADRWVSKPIKLYFRLGDLYLWVVTFHGKQLSVHSSKLPSDLSPSSSLLGEFFSGLEVRSILAHPIERKVSRLLLLPHTIRYAPEQYRRYFVDLRGLFDDYLRKFSSKSRSTLARKIRRFAEFSGEEIEWREFRRVEEVEEFHCLAREVSKKTWQERIPLGGFPDTDEFRRELFDLASHGRMRGYILFHLGKPISYAYCLAQDDALLYGRLGYDPEFKRWSPGTVLLYLILQRLFAEGNFRLFDFGGQENWYKDFFSTRVTLCADVYYLPRTWRNYVILALHSAFVSLNRAAGKILDVFGIKARVKRVFRRRA